MDKFREFQGKDLDECINAACAFFDAPREKLEIEIVQDAKSGIFGIVLARKAKIRARRAELKEAVRDLLHGEASGHKPAEQKQPAQKSAEQKPAGQSAAEQAPSGHKQPEQETVAEKPRETPQKKRESREPEKRPRAAKGARPAQQAGHSEKRDNQPEKRKHAPAQHPQRQKQPIHEEAMPEVQDQGEFEIEDEGLPLRPMEELDAEKLAELTREVVGMLVRPIAGHEVNVSVTTGYGSIHARVDWKGDAGLLIGREGQTLAALQYLASRMLSHSFNAALRVQLDIGDYRRRQDEKLRALGMGLAEKARQTGRSWSTKPLSSYHRRIIHMALQDAPDVQTRSSGEGSLKRVIISPKRHADKE